MTLPLKRPQRGRERDIAFSLITLIFYFVGGFSIIPEVLVTLSEDVCVAGKMCTHLCRSEVQV